MTADVHIMTPDPRLAPARAAFARGDYQAALVQAEKLIRGTPDGGILAFLAETMARLGHRAEAAGLFEQAAEAGHLPETCRKRAAVLYLEAGHEDAAQLLALQLLKILPEDPAVVFVLVSIFLKNGERELVDALKNRLVASDEPEHLLLAARLLPSDSANPANLVLFRKLNALFPEDPYIRMSLLGYAREFCDFETVEREETRLRAAMAAGDYSDLAAEEPHAAVMWLESDEDLRRATNLGPFPAFTEESRRARRAAPHAWGEKIRIGYLSADFWDDHATMRLLAEVLRRHDPARFEITLFCNTPERFIRFDGGGRETWGRIVPIRDLGDEEAAALIRAEGIDILVDLKGHTGNNRAGVVNLGAAPVQVAWLGFPGTCIAVDCDYVIGDRFVLPDGAQPHYHELFCRLPDTYQPNDPVSRPLPPAASRAELGLPEDVFLFASFNSAKKLTPRTLDLWARVLAEAPKAHLWIMAPGDAVLSAFAARGIDSARIHIAAKCAYASHVARVQAADLGLDTFPCNGHTTTSDMLWAGLPVVTMRGQGFPSRVSESLLHAIGLPELVAPDDDAFVTLAAGLAKDPDRLKPLRQRLIANRFTAPLFDAERFCRNLERGFEVMAERARAGLEPVAFDVVGVGG
jgi:hypothetical protein